MDGPEGQGRADFVTVRLPVAGMRCLSCVLHLESALEDVPGVVSASVDLADADATVLCQPGAVSREDLIAAIVASGYRVPAHAPNAGADQ